MEIWLRVNFLFSVHVHLVIIIIVSAPCFLHLVRLFEIECFFAFSYAFFVNLDLLYWGFASIKLLFAVVRTSHPHKIDPLVANIIHKAVVVLKVPLFDGVHGGHWIYRTATWI